MVIETIRDGANGMGALAPGQKFAERKLDFSAEANRIAATNTEIFLKYPYPPANCDEALTRVAQIKEEIKQHNELIATGASKNVHQRYISSLQGVLGNFQNYSLQSKCEKQVLQQEDAAWTNQWQDILNKEQAQSSGVKKTDTWIIFGVLGLLVIGSLVIILKKKK